jgi:hypothetical protein
MYTRMYKSLYTPEMDCKSTAQLKSVVTTYCRNFFFFAWGGGAGGCISK